MQEFLPGLPSARRGLSWRTMCSTIVSTEASIDTATGFSSAAGGSSVLNWLSNSPGGMKWPLRRAFFVLLG
ncbi:MAG: hypothetical protein WCC91_02870 [Bradyrhizobium sp.]